jgi:predicted ester cyclase
MTTGENKLLIQRYIHEIINTGNVENIDQFVSPDYAEIYEGKRYVLGIEGAKEHVLGVRRTYPDLQLTVEHQIAEAEWVATSIVARGTHRGVWLGMKPTGKALVYSGINIDKIVHGRIVEHGGAANMLSPLLEVGALRVVGPE